MFREKSYSFKEKIKMLKNKKKTCKYKRIQFSRYKINYFTLYFLFPNKHVFYITEILSNIVFVFNKNDYFLYN